MPEKHIPIMVEEFLSFLSGKKIKIAVDGTLGLGGHAKALLESHPEIETFISIDEDSAAMELAKKRLEPFACKITYINGNFRDIKEHLADLGIYKVDTIFLDIGVSSLQLDDGSRGMSFSKEGPLDMRRDPSMPITAADIVNRYSEKELQRIFLEYGEEPRWRRIAKAIVEARRKKAFRTTQDLVQLLTPLLPRLPHKKINPLTLVFQGLRIAVNDELGALRTALPDAIQLLQPEGILGVISFHSLEDRIVKNIFRLAASKSSTSPDIEDLELEPYPTAELLTRKPLVPSETEIKSNPRSRSAKMRFIKKIPPNDF